MNLQAYKKAEFVDETRGKPKKKSPPQEEKVPEKVESDGRKNKGSKTKFVPLLSSDGTTKSVLIPDRHPCQCLASRHKLIANCLNCGRIVCAQEGSGPCFTCSKLVCTREEREILARDDKRSEALLKKLVPSGPSGKSSTGLNIKEIANELHSAKTEKFVQGLEKAVQQKEKLLEFDRTCEKRTQVIDDEADYFTVDSNQWLTSSQRQKLKDRLEKLSEKKQSRQQNITLDFSGRQIVENKQNVDIYDVNDPLVQEIFFGASVENEDIWNKTDPKSTSDYHPKYQETDAPKRSGVVNEVCKQKRIQDREQQEMLDEGWCLSLHQPYASLLIAGIKKHEGRSWYTAHRGRLWIAAAGKQPSSQEIKEMEHLYTILAGNENVIFPEQYPVGCLLGCVDLMECMPQEQYREEYPHGECEASYVFLCENPQELIVKFPMQGKHKIYKLDQRIHQAAQKTLQKKF